MGVILRQVFSSLIRVGSLEVETADGVVATYGDGTGPRIAVRIMDRGAETALLLDPTLALGELYMDGRIVVKRGDLYDLIALGARNIAMEGGPRWFKWIEAARVLTRRRRQNNDRQRARKHIAHHYDLNVRLYDLFLDIDRQYSCGYFERPSDTLEQAQLAKKRHIAAKLLVDEGHEVLDIGCGFGGMALYLAEMAGAHATGSWTLDERGTTCRRPGPWT